MSNLIIFETNLSPQQFNTRFKAHIILYTLSILAIGFLSYDLIFSRFNIDRDNIIYICVIGISALSVIFHGYYLEIFRNKFFNSFNPRKKNDQIDEIKGYILEMLEKINMIKIGNDVIKKEKKNDNLINKPEKFKNNLEKNEEEEVDESEV